MLTFCSVLIGLFLFLGQSRKGLSCFSMAYHNCYICFDKGKEDLIFKNCTKQQCIIHSDLGCLQYQQKQLNQQSCFQNCCKSYQNSVSNLQRIKICEYQNNLVIGLILGLTIGLFTVIFIIFFICGCCDCCHSFRSCLKNYCQWFIQIFRLICQKCCKEDNKDESQQTRQQQSGQELRKENYQKFKVNKNQIINISSRNQLQNSICSICLGLKPNTQTSCSHYFHAQCIWNWFQRKGICPNCPNKNISIVKFHCHQGCSIRYFELNLDHFPAQISLKNKLRIRKVKLTQKNKI